MVLVIPDERQFVLAILSAMRAGVIAAPVYPPFILSQVEAYTDTLRQTCRAAGATVCLTSKLLADLLRAADLPCRIETFEDLAGAPLDRVARSDQGDPAFIQFTSGSTGAPKGVVVPNRTLIAHATALGEVLAIDGARDRGLSWLPLYHDMGLIGNLFVALVTRTSTWYVSPLAFVRDPLAFLRLMTDVGGTISFSPNFAYGLLAKRAGGKPLDGIDLSSWRVAGCGAEPVRAETIRRFADTFAGVGFNADALLPCYGMAEATLAVSIAPVGTGARTLTVDTEALRVENLAVPTPDGTTELVSCGRPLAGTDVRIVDPSGTAVADRTVGEIIVRSGTLAAGYFADPAATEQTWRDGWLHTGDTGLLDDGELYVTGRIKDLIIINGRNYQPHDIESAVEHVEGVRENNVVAVAVRRGDSEAVRLVLEVGPNVGGAVADRVRETVQRRFAIPVAEVIVLRKGTLPKTSSGKLRRRHTSVLLDTGELKGATR